MKTALLAATGTFIGNWLIVPLIFERTFKEGFAIGILAALIVLGIYAILPRLTRILR